jgi:hypothetical protein
MTNKPSSETSIGCPSVETLDLRRNPMNGRESWTVGALALLLAMGTGMGKGDRGMTVWAGGEPADAGPPAPATPAEEYAQVEAAVKAHLRDKDADGTKADGALVLRQSTSCPEEGLRAKYRALLGTMLQSSRDEDVRKVLLEAIAETKDASLFRYVRPHLAMPNPKEAPPLLLPAIEAAGSLAADEGASILVGLVKDAKRMEVAQAAMKALGSYGANKRVRARIVGDLVATVRKDRPGVGQRPDYSSGTMQPTARIRTGDDQVSRWEALSGALVQTLNKMTGQNVGTAEDWFDLYDRYKGRPAVLFPSDTSGT